MSWPAAGAMTAAGDNSTDEHGRARTIAAKRQPEGRALTDGILWYAQIDVAALASSYKASNVLNDNVMHSHLYLYYSGAWRRLFPARHFWRMSARYAFSAMKFKWRGSKLDLTAGIAARRETPMATAGSTSMECQFQAAITPELDWHGIRWAGLCRGLRGNCARTRRNRATPYQ